MACGCHGKQGVATRKTSPFDQCTMCARKHIKNAWSKWNELSYEEDNRDYCSAQLRDAADHLKADHRDVALRCRDLAVAIENNQDKDYASIAQELDELRNVARELFYADHPDAKERLEEMRKEAQNNDNSEEADNG